MGFDIHGLNPRVNTEAEDYPTYNKFDKMSFKEKWKILEADKELQTKYWDELSEFEKDNPGKYFRNNCWWWRPLWDYVYNELDILTEKEWESGHYNDGFTISESKATQIGIELHTHLASGRVTEYKKEYEEREKDAEYQYPFDTENVRAFADFCIQSGGFDIC